MTVWKAMVFAVLFVVGGLTAGSALAFTIVWLAGGQ